MNCPQCKGPMTDQTATKQNPKQPDFTCQNASCVNDKGYRTGVWLQKPQAQRNAAPQQAARGTKWTWPQLSVTYRRALLIANQHVPQVLKNATATDVVAAAATLFIAASRDGVSEPVKEQPATSQPLHERPAALNEPDDSDVPF